MKYDLTQSARDFLSKYQSGKFPIHVISVANELGIEVFSDSNYPSQSSGHIEIDEQEKASIIVNDNDCYGRKRFTIAHEIAHYVMDMDYLKEHKSIDRNGNASDPTYRARERRANDFAADLLMPEKEFVHQYIVTGDLDKVADYFGVSKPAAKWRAINAGLLKAE